MQAALIPVVIMTTTGVGMTCILLIGRGFLVETRVMNSFIWGVSAPSFLSLKGTWRTRRFILYNLRNC